MIRGLLIVSALFIVAADAKEDAVKADLKKLQGRWLLERLERNGFDATKASNVEGYVFEFLDAKFFMWRSREKKAGKDSIGYSITIDPSKDPKHIDIKELALGIYKIEGDTLIICWDIERPTEFKGPKDKFGWRLWTLKRLKD